jgi:peptidoglycan hydrolase-like protein with peptidoglycan-binding domain
MEVFMIKKVMTWLLIGSTLALGGGFAGVTEHFSQPGYKLGTVSREVYWLQRSLNEVGFYSNPVYTLNYGPATQEAVKAFQRSVGLTADGIAGTATLAQLEAKQAIPEVKRGVYKFGDTSKNVYWIQSTLIQLGYLDLDKPTDFYGARTEDAIKAFQTQFRIAADGTAGEAVLAKMAELGYILLSTTESNTSTAPVSAQNTVVSRGAGERRIGEYVSWNDIQGQLNRGSTVLTIEDFKTGTMFKVKVTYGGVHADVETLTKEDTEIVKKLWGGDFSWSRRAVLVHINNRMIAASMNGMPHAGLENEPEGKYVSNRSAGYGYGYNFDMVKNNGMSGHICLHFKDSKLHSTRKIDPSHQATVRVAAGIN